MCLGTIQCGWGILGNAQCSLILIEKFGWAKDETKWLNSTLSSIGLIGVAIGSMFGGPIIIEGRRRGIFIMSAVMLVGITMTLIENYPSMVIGRFITGFCAGIFQMCNIKAVQETVPIKYTGFYGSFSGAFLAFGCGLAVFIGGVSLPIEKEDYAADQMWRLTYGFPLLIVIVQVLFVWLQFKYEPIDFSIKRGRDVEALNFIRIIYNTPKTEAQDPETKEITYKRYLAQRRIELVANEVNSAKVTFKEALFG